jgi:hypothetical protein
LRNAKLKREATAASRKLNAYSAFIAAALLATLATLLATLTTTLLAATLRTRYVPPLFFLAVRKLCGAGLSERTLSSCLPGELCDRVFNFVLTPTPEIGVGRVWGTS